MRFKISGTYIVSFFLISGLLIGCQSKNEEQESLSQEADISPVVDKIEIISGNYHSGLLFLAYNGEYVTGYYNNGRYEGNPNFGCSFYFFGNSIDLIDDRKINIKTMNPFNKSEAAKIGTFQLHGEEDTIFSLIVNLSGEDCWDKELGFSKIGESPGVSFELSEEKDWLEVRIASSEKVYFYESANDSTRKKAYVVEGDPLLISKSVDDWVRATYLTSVSETSGWVKKNATISLMELAQKQ